MKEVVSTTLNTSLGVQWASLVYNLYALVQTVPPVHAILKDVLTLEMIVQIIQLSFYMWYASQIHRLADVTKHRYADWVITTPLMLFTTMVYYEYRNSDKPFTLEDFWNRYWKEVLAVSGFNLWMLVFGYLQEIGRIGLVSSTLFGFAGLFASFAIIYRDFASKTASNLPLFWFMFIVWSLYGVAAWFPVALKNASYNILDIVSKNFYGIFLSYLVVSVSTT